MSKLFSFGLVLLLLLGIFGCTQQATVEETSESSSEEATEIATAAEEASDDSDLDIASEEDDLGEII